MGVDIQQMMREILKDTDQLTKEIEHNNLDNVETLFIKLKLCSKFLRGMARWPILYRGDKIFDILSRLLNIVKRLISLESPDYKLNKTIQLLSTSIISHYPIFIDPMTLEVQKGGSNEKKVQLLITEFQEFYKYLFSFKHVDLDKRGIMGAINQCSQLNSSHEDIVSLHNLLENIVKKKVRDDIKDYGSQNFSLVDLTWSLNKMLAYYEDNIEQNIFQEEIVLISTFIIDEFIPDLENQRKKVKFSFQPLTQIAWSFTKLIDLYKTKEFTNNFKRFMIAFRLNMSTIKIQPSDSIALSSMIASLSRVNLYSEDFNEDIQKVLIPRLLELDNISRFSQVNTVILFNIIKNNFKVYSELLDLAVLLEQSGTYLNESSVDKIMAWIPRVLPSQNDSSIKQKNTIKEDILIIIVKIATKSLLKSKHSTNRTYINLLRLYSIEIRINKSRNKVLESSIIMQHSRSRLNLSLSVVYLDAILSNINKNMDEDVESVNKVGQLFQDPNFLVKELITSNTNENVFSKLYYYTNFIYNINETIRRSYATSNRLMYQRITQFADQQRGLILEILKLLMEKDTNAKVFQTSGQVNMISKIIQAFFNVERRLSVKTTPKMLENIPLIIRNKSFAEALVFISPFYKSTVANEHLLSQIEVEMHENLNKRFIPSSYLNTIKMWGFISSQKLYNPSFGRLLEQRTIEELDFIGGKINQKEIYYLIGYMYSYKNNKELVLRMLRMANDNLKRIINKTTALHRTAVIINLLKKVEIATLSIKNSNDRDIQQLIQEIEIQLNEIKTNTDFFKRNSITNFLSSNLQEKVKEVLDEIGLEYEEEVRIGPYLIDFYLPELNKVIEVFGPVHFTGQTQELNQESKARVESIKNLGYEVIEMRNTDIDCKNADRVDILLAKMEE